jgi:hypothetical protein
MKITLGQFESCKRASVAAVTATFAAMTVVISGCAGSADTTQPADPPRASSAKRETVLALSHERGLLAKAMMSAGWTFNTVDAALLANHPDALIYIDVTSPAFASPDVRAALSTHPGRVLFDSHDHYEMPIVAVGEDGKYALAKHASNGVQPSKTAEEMTEELFRDAALSSALFSLLGTGTASTAAMAYGTAITPFRVSADGSIDGDTPIDRLAAANTFAVDATAAKLKSATNTRALKVGIPPEADLKTSYQIYMSSNKRIHDETRWGTNASVQGAAWCMNSDGQCQRIVQAFVNASSVFAQNAMGSNEGITPLPDNASCRTYRLGSLEENGLPNGVMTHTPDRLLCTSNVGTQRVDTAGARILVGPYADYFTVATELRFADSKPCARLVQMTPKPKDIPISDDIETSHASGWTVGGTFGANLLTAPVYNGTVGANFAAGYVNTTMTTKVTRFWDVKDQSGGTTKCGGNSSFTSPGATSRLSLFRKVDDRMKVGNELDSTGPDYYWTEILRQVEDRMPAMSVYGWGSDHEARYQVTYNGTASKRARVIGKIGVGLEYIQLKGEVSRLGQFRRKFVNAIVERTSGYNAPPFVTTKLAFEIWGIADFDYRALR